MYGMSTYCLECCVHDAVILVALFGAYKVTSASLPDGFKTAEDIYASYDYAILNLEKPVAIPGIQMQRSNVHTHCYG